MRKFKIGQRVIVPLDLTSTKSRIYTITGYGAHFDDYIAESDTGKPTMLKLDHNYIQWLESLKKRDKKTSKHKIKRRH